jgi:hypothetical protein
VWTLMMRRACHLLATAPQSCASDGQVTRVTYSGGAERGGGYCVVRARIAGEEADSTLCEPAVSILESVHVD